jgi:hypothetical protein
MDFFELRHHRFSVKNFILARFSIPSCSWVILRDKVS